MHVAMVTAFSKDPHHITGGVAGVAKYLVDELVKNPNLKMTIVVPTYNITENICEEWGNFKVYRISKKGLCSFLSASIYDIFAGKRQLNSILRQINPDLVHFQNVAFLAANCKWPHVLTIHGIVEKDAIWDKRWGHLRWLKWILLKLTEEYGRRRVPFMILISDYVKEFLPGKNKIRKTWRIDNPIAESFFDIKWQFEPGRIFCSSRITPLKNILGLINAFADVVQYFPKSKLRIAGTADAAYLKLCQQEIEVNKLGSAVCLLGNLSIEEIQLELSKANCLVMPSFQENAPLAIEEAMAVGVPVVAARVGGVPGIVTDGKSGFLVNPYNTKDISKTICRILSDEKLAKVMSKCAKEIARRRFMAPLICKQTLQAYQEILSQE